MALTSFWSTTKGDVPAIIATINNTTSTRDPLVTDDNTAGYGIGSIWINGAAGAMRWWECISAATGAAVWSFGGAAYGAGGMSPSSEVVQFGSGTAGAAAEGNTYRSVTAGTNPSTINGDYVIGAYTLPANSFDIAGRGINIVAQGSFAATANNKRLKVIFGATTATIGALVAGGTTICDTGVVTGNGVGWALEANVFKLGAAGSNTQQGLHVSAQSGAVVSSLLAPTPMTYAENAPILIAITANATTATTDILLNFVEINAMN